MIIAIDGTTSSGKGTLAKRLATHFGLPHLDTGLLYRAVAAKALREGVALSDAAACARLAQSLDLRELDARDARQALESALSHPPDLLLIDLDLPDGDGMTLLGRLRPAAAAAR